MDTINEHIIKFTGKATALNALELGHNYKILVDGEITTLTRSNNQNGTIDVIYRFEPIIATIEKDNGEVIKTKDTRSKSEQLRKVVWKLWTLTSTSMDKETYYEKFMNLVIANAEAIAGKIQ